MYSKMVTQLISIYNEVENRADPETNKWFLINSIWILILTACVYLYVSLVQGPKFMKNRKPFKINKLVTIYNVIQVIFNVYLFIWSINLVLNLRSFLCMRVVSVQTEEGYYEQRAFYWLFTMNKFLDLLDTIFFILKKKSSHVSVLHVYHHIITLGACWTMTRYYPGGQFIMIGVLNSLVHCVMYSYYLLSLGNRFKKICTFIKKHITQMQIVQLIIFGICAAHSLTVPACSHYPEGIAYFLLTQAVVLTGLFFNFYYKAYLKSRKTDHKPTKKSPLKND